MIHKTHSKKYPAIMLTAALAGFIPAAQNALAQTPAEAPAPAPMAPVASESWKSKPIASWTDRDAEQILERSPWAKMTVAGIARM